MKVLFAVSNEEISEAIVKRYQKEYKEIISYKNVYYFNAILKEIQKDKSYDRVVISEELEAFTNTQYDQIDKFIFEKLDSISDEAANNRGDNTPIVLICSDRRTKGEEMLVKLFGIGIYDALIGNDRSVEEVCKLINKPRSKKEAKIYYKVESDEVKYQSENENDVSEQEIQNILAHYKKLGKNEDKYVASFNNIVEQYNDAQLRIISKFLPLNVRAVLEEKSPKYQQIMSFNNMVTDSIRRPRTKEQDLGPSGKLLKPKNQNTVLSGPVVIPSSVNTNNVRKLARNHPTEEETNSELNAFQNANIQSQNIMNSNLEPNQINDDLEDMFFSENTEPKRRGRPKKEVTEFEDLNNIEPKTPKRRGRPRKNPLPEQEVETHDDILPGFDEDEDDNTLPGFDENNNALPGLEDLMQEKAILPGFENINNNEQQTNNNTILPGFETVKNMYKQPNAFQAQPNYSQSQNNDMQPEDYEPVNSNYDSQPNYEPVNSNYDSQPNYEPINSNYSNQADYNTMNLNYSQQKTYEIEPSQVNNYEQQQYNPMPSADLSRLLTGDKKIVTFVGTSKNGTSFILNNLAEYASSMGINVAILDTTQNKNSYYIYTKNEEELRQVASTCLDNLVHGQARGISVNRNLTVYTSLPEDREDLNNVNQILETLVRMHSLVLIDCDFNTPEEYFLQAQEIYLVQSLDILTIQPLTAFLRELKAHNILDESKIKIILNKYVKVRGISEKTIIGGMSKYNDPAMSFMTDLFDINSVKYITIPFEQDIYSRYLESVINCDVSIKGYSKTFMQVLKELSNWVYPMVPGSNTYRPPAPSYSSTFSPNMSNTLNQMKRKY